MYSEIVCIYIYVSKCKWYLYIMYMYVNKHVELAQRGIALQKMYLLLLLSNSTLGEPMEYPSPWDTVKMNVR